MNKELEKLLLEIASEIPYVGFAISGILEFFWPKAEKDSFAIWNEFKEYILNLVNKLIDEEKVKDLEKN